ncbi:MAG: SHOCT domain-containing protein [Chloroflexi bacterium]|nr:SHOCT domain-containing protein [Chloroflexota bacterium]MBI2979721.1 SHOCT domain-containing protein [Chloroflexota bacterium]
MMGPGMMGGYGTMWLMPIFWIVLLGVIIWAVAAAARGTGQLGSYDSVSRPDSALEILKKRYARGEINKEEFEERKKDLI